MADELQLDVTRAGLPVALDPVHDLVGAADHAHVEAALEGLELVDE
jgi:hypothetical protein